MVGLHFAVFFSILLALAPSVDGHGMMVQPAARNVMTDFNYCPQCLNAGGPWSVSDSGTLIWPAGVHGICGDAGTGGPNDVPAAAPVANYVTGQTITIQLLITARHGGRHVFRLCDKSVADEGCLGMHTLQR